MNDFFSVSINSDLMLIHSKLLDYQVDIHSKLPEPFKPGAAFFVIDRAIYHQYPQLFEALSSEDLFVFESTEENKTIELAMKICERLLENQCQRQTTLVAIGGGIVQDIAGFVASIYYRGIPWVFYPTTLLAQADSCIGGKTSLNFHQRKNLLGTFYPPQKIVICLQFLLTLSEKQFRSGVGEVIKLHLIGGKKMFEKLFEKKESLFSRDLDQWADWIQSSLEIKKKFIEADEHDLGLRKILNFGHTCGHALEAATHFEVPHGQAVLLGIMIADEISCRRGELSQSLKKRVEALCLDIITTSIPVKEINFEQFFTIVALDKKNEKKAIVEILLDEELSPRIVKDLKKEEIEEALIAMLALVS